MPLVGRSGRHAEIYRVLARLMLTDLTLMITGRSGTGKSSSPARAARLRQAPQRPSRRHQHGRDPRADLIEIELFGHARGAFTGAQTRSAAASSRPRAARCSSTRSATC